MTDKGKGKATVADLAKQLIAGTTKHSAGLTQVSLLGSSYTPADITTKLQQVVTLRSDVDAAKATTQAKLATEATDMPPLRTFTDAYVAYVKAVYGSAPDTLADFGLKPKKARVSLTVDAKAAAAAKRASTRVARKTMGSKQKLAVTGNVVGITVTPVTAPAPIAAAPVSPTAGTTSPSPTATPAPHATTS